jgi:hypothetical protein
MFLMSTSNDGSLDQVGVQLHQDIGAAGYDPCIVARAGEHRDRSIQRFRRLVCQFFHSQPPFTHDEQEPFSGSCTKRPAKSSPVGQKIAGRAFAA